MTLRTSTVALLHHLEDCAKKQIFHGTEFYRDIVDVEYQLTLVTQGAQGDRVQGFAVYARPSFMPASKTGGVAYPEYMRDWPELAPGYGVIASPIDRKRYYNAAGRALTKIGGSTTTSIVLRNLDEFAKPHRSNILEIIEFVKKTNNVKINFNQIGLRKTSCARHDPRLVEFAV